MTEQPKNAAEKSRRGIQSIEIGGRLLTTLVEEGSPMSLGDLAKKAGVSQQQIAKYEDAINKINASRLALLAKVLNKEIAYFYEST
jgi:predicted transcriptional regulator